jgi:hypothetical protein
LIESLKANELRFYGRTTGHSRVLHFTTKQAACVTYARTGYYGCRGIETEFTPLADHTALLPATATHFFHNDLNFALTDYTFYDYGVGHWAVRGAGDRWEVDDWVGDWNSTLHRVFVRSGPPPIMDPGGGPSDGEGGAAGGPGEDAPTTLASCSAIHAYDSTLPSGVYTIVPDGIDAYSAYCDMTLDGGGWTVFYAGLNGSRNVVAFFDSDYDVCPDAHETCLRHLPASLDTNAEIAATCGAASLKFSPPQVLLTFLQTGYVASGAFQPLANVSSISGGNPAFARHFYTGSPDNAGWLILDADDTTGTSTFASAYPADNFYDYCNGVEEGPGASSIRLLYR